MPIDGQMQAVLDQFAKLNPPALERLSPENARNAPTLKNAVEEMAAHSMTARAMNVALPIMPEPVGQIDHVLIPATDRQLLARVYRPSGNGPFPILVYFHGGGWVIANLDVYEASCRGLCNAAECVVVSVAYRQAPEHKYPAAAEDAYAATQWILANGAQVGGDETRVAVGGESAGGNLATVACLMARDRGGRMPAGQMLIYPVTDIRMSTPSYRECERAVPLKSAMMPWFWNHYVRDLSQGLEPYASPCNASAVGLPPALVITAEVDPLRDEGEAYARQLTEAGVQVRATRYDGVSHEFFGLAGAVNQAKAALHEAAEWLKDVWRR